MVSFLVVTVSLHNCFIDPRPYKLQTARSMFIFCGVRLFKFENGISYIMAQTLADFEGSSLLQAWSKKRSSSDAMHRRLPDLLFQVSGPRMDSRPAAHQFNPYFMW